MLSLVPEASRVILMGASEFPRDPDNLPPIPAVRANIQDLEAVLTGYAMGIPRKNIEIILDERNPSYAAEKIVKASREAEDTLIVYYAGHGLVGQNTSELFLATKLTTVSEAEYNSLRWETVRRAIGESMARTRIVVLDCCFSGRALDIMAAEDSLLQAALEIEGTSAIASAPANQTAKAPPGERYTTSTGELLWILREGIDNGKEGITLKEIYEHICTEFRRCVHLPVPQQAIFLDIDNQPTAYSVRSFLAPASGSG